MKIVCDSCGAKYSIADEKVAGKVFKIRCKKCSSVIVVRGDQVPAAEEAEQATAVYDYGGDAVWHVVVAGEQQGPLAPAQIGSMLTEGTIDWEAYVWREGFDGWIPARDVPELVEAVTGQPAPAAAAGAAAATAADTGPNAAQEPTAGAPAEEAAGAADPFGGAGEAAASDPFAAAATGGESSPFGAAADAAPVAQRATHDAGADLFAQAEGGASPFGAAAAEGGTAAGDVVASPSPLGGAPSGGGGAMTGQRNENSVLFSLQNLQALATGDAEQAPAAGPGPASGPGGGAGHAMGEGSGLIDIRALASATATVGGGGGAAPGGTADKSSVDDLLSIGGGGMGPALGAPILAPAAEPEKSNKTVLFAAVGVAALALIGVVVVLIVVLGRDEQPLAVAAPGAVGSTGPAAASPGEGPSAAVPSAAEAAAEEEEEDAEEDDVEEDEEDDVEEDEGSSSSSARRSRSGSRRSRSGSRSSGSSETATAAAPSAPSPAPAKRRGGDDIDSLLDRALGGEKGGGGGSRQRRAAPAANLPDTPNRNQVLSAMSGVRGAVSSCGGSEHGVVKAQVTVQGTTGRVTSANVTGPVSQSVKSCVARAVRGARFPKFKRPTFSVTFPYSL